MTLNGLLPVFARDPQLAQAIDRAKDLAKSHEVIGPRALSPMLMALLAEPAYGDRTLLAVTATTREAEDLATELRGFLAADAVVEFPAWETLPHERLSPTHDTVGRRLQVLRRLAHPDDRWSGSGEIKVVVAGVRRCCNPSSPDSGTWSRSVCGLVKARGLGRRRATCVDWLRAHGLGDAAWELAVRGGIVDVFVPTDDHPHFASNSSAMRSRRSGRSRSRTSVRWTWWSADCGRRRVVKCC